MTTQDVVNHRSWCSVRRVRCVALIMLAILAPACWASGNSEPVPAVDAAVSVSFDGEACSWEGPTPIGQGTVDISVSNSSDVDFHLAGFLMRESARALELERLPVGSDMDVVSQRLVFPDGEMAFGWWISPGEPVNRRQLVAAGVYLIDCLTGGPFDHVWRVAQIEVVAE